MTRDECVKLLGWRLGDRTDMAERILMEMKHVQRHVLEENVWLPWFLETELAEATTTTGERRLPLPEDFLSEIEESHLWIVVDGNPLRLVKGEYDTLQSLLPGEATPQRFAISGRYFHLFPTPDGAYPIQMRYYGRDTDMTVGNEETKWLLYASDVVLAAVGKEVAEKHLQNAAQAQGFAMDLNVAWNRLLMKHTAYQELNMARSMRGNS